MAAPTNAANVRKALANSEPSTHGTSATSQGRRSTSASLIGRSGSSAFRLSTHYSVDVAHGLVLAPAAISVHHRHARGLGKPEFVRFPRVHAFLRDPSERLGLRAREETGGQANACQPLRDQGAANGQTARKDRKAGPLALPGSARLDGLLCCADERLSDLSIPASHDRTLARRSDASKPKMRMKKIARYTQLEFFQSKAERCDQRAKWSACLICFI